jgi:hypothetical protein
MCPGAVIGAAPHVLWPIFPGKDFLDIQDRVSYSSTMNKQCFIKLALAKNYQVKEHHVFVK